MTTFTVSDTASFNNAIAQANATLNASVEIDLAADITLNAQLTTLNIGPGTTLTINGGNHRLSGADGFRGFVVYAGNVLKTWRSVTRSPKAATAAMEWAAGVRPGLAADCSLPTIPRTARRPAATSRW